jgi:hypothetical protein
VAGLTKLFLHSVAINLNSEKLDSGEQKVDHGSTNVKQICQPLISESTSSAAKQLHRTSG